MVSETMAQQTQMPRVIDAFESFMRRFPTVHDLAAATEQEVLSSWNGLGYYRRARNLHAAAREVVRRFGGVLPEAPEILRELPGVGRYTAGAIASIAFGRPTPIVDGNVARVLLRVNGRAGSADIPATNRWLWSEAERLVLASGDPAALNEGLMELGAVICTPKAPRCAACPLLSICEAHREGRTDQIPRPKRRAARQQLHQHVAVVRRGQRLLIEQRPTVGLWAGMWQAPTVEGPSLLQPQSVLRRLPLKVTSLKVVGDFMHATTHREVLVHVFTARTAFRRGRWIEAAALHAVPMGTAARKAIDLAMDRAGSDMSAASTSARRSAPKARSQGKPPP